MAIEGPAPVPDGKPIKSFWEVDHFKSDSEYHSYCDDCYRMIPTFLVRDDRQHALVRDMFGHPFICEGCGYHADPADAVPH